jgi:hypothetical protein
MPTHPEALIRKNVNFTYYHYNFTIREGCGIFVIYDDCEENNEHNNQTPVRKTTETQVCYMIKIIIMDIITKPVPGKRLKHEFVI